MTFLFIVDYTYEKDSLMNGGGGTDNRSKGIEGPGL